MTISIFFHIHHDVLMEPTWDIQERIAYIKAWKLSEEQELRLALLKDATELLPHNDDWDAYDKACAAYNEAWSICDKAYGAYDKVRADYERGTRRRGAYAAYNQAWADYDNAHVACNRAWIARNKAWLDYLATFDVEAFHAEHCHPRCPWDGGTIFSRGTSIDVLAGENTRGEP